MTLSYCWMIQNSSSCSSNSLCWSEDQSLATGLETLEVSRTSPNLQEQHPYCTKTKKDYLINALTVTLYSASSPKALKSKPQYLPSYTALHLRIQPPSKCLLCYTFTYWLLCFSMNQWVPFQAYPLLLCSAAWLETPTIKSQLILNLHCPLDHSHSLF